MAKQQDFDICAERRITVGMSPEEAYRAWREPGNLARFLAENGSVDVLDDRRSRWSSMLPGAAPGEVEIVEERENQAIGWSTGGHALQGVVSFAPAPRELGTEVTLNLWGSAPGGRLADAVASLVGRSADELAFRMLRNFKQLMETGVVASNAGPHGQASHSRQFGTKGLALAAVAILSAYWLFSRRRPRMGRASYRTGLPYGGWFNRPYRESVLPYDVDTYGHPYERMPGQMQGQFAGGPQDWQAGGGI